jgi:predicted ABC-type ATPase
VWVNPNQAKQAQGRIAGDAGGNISSKAKNFISPEKFNAADWSKQYVDSKATPDDAGVQHVLDSFGNGSATELKKKIDWAIKENDKIKDEKRLTADIYRISGEGREAAYTQKRKSKHGEIIQKMLSPDKVEIALPKIGEKPTFMMLGGRGGSGKSWFKNNVYDPKKFVILDADWIKEQLPEYDGWNANQVHEESSDILEKAIDKCVALGLNVVLDMTMKTPKSALARLAAFKEKGYRTEAHYMHLPPQEAAKRAITRYRDGDDKPGEYKGRFVPPGVILSMRSNEGTFDQIKDLVDDWSFRDSTGGFPPALISQKNGENRQKGLA